MPSSPKNSEPSLIPPRDNTISPSPASAISTSPAIARSLARQSGAASPSSAGAGGGSGPSIPNIPPRSGSISSQVRPNLSASFKSPVGGLTPPIARSGSPAQGKELQPKPSSDNLLGRKTSVSSGNTNQNKSALTTSLNSPSLSRQSSSDNIPRPTTLSRDNSGTSTPRKSKEVENDGGAGDSNFSNLADIPDEEKAKVLRRHLVSAEEREQSKTATPNEGGVGGTTPTKEEGPGSGSASVNASGVERAAESGVTSGYGSTEDNEQFPIPYDAVGGDVTHDLYKWQHSHRPDQPVRSASFSHIPLDRSAILDPTLAHIKEPGGFRRNFVSTRAAEQGLEAPNMVRNVVDFLFLYGHFAGEDLNEDDDLDEDEMEEEDEESYPAIGSSSGRPYNRRPFTAEADGDTGLPIARGERAPLLGSTKRGMSMTRHRRTKSGAASGGTATTTQALLMLLKGFVGTGILFMGKAFFNGGILFSTIVMLAIAGISLWSFLLLVEAYMHVPGSFGDIGGALYGKYMRFAILISIAVSQIGFVAAYTIFIAENLQAFFMAVTDCKTYIPVKWLILGQLLIFLPLAMIRNLAKLSGTALIADAFILIGLIYIGFNEGSVLSKYGVADVKLFNENSFPLLIGTAVFAFEGIGLVIPITESMREPEKFPRLLSIVMFIVAVLFAGAGVSSYAAYGSDIQTVVIVNLPQEDKFVQAVQFLYSVAILLSIPLQLFPAVRIMENGIFSRSGKHNSSVKWQKNIFRSVVVVFTSLLSWAGSSELDKFVSLIGSFACIPLCFIYPPMLHLKACAKTRKAIVLDYLLIVFGTIVGAYTTVQTVRSLFEPGGDKPKFGKCEVPNGM
ncbi:solute carrier family 36 (proton-coupled amino acid transporter) [Kwoniella mangroviensis CBS 10435]|uniref:Solute carrier family 36 (Proton-coupled amino acid transporter) n=1 Tax=Kwoniella mangroviensis CBS 10435 TaxID=1331196 RepID=A0A1B9J3A6_9TREE|nr:solute carrier family 36 (proton-coupled amino acid transporter) [Kwoniella mangroviensis CBS 10435]